MIFHKVRILVEVDRLHGEARQALAPIGIGLREAGDAAAAEAAAGAILIIHP